MENYHSDCDINLDCDCHHLGCDQLYALNGNRNNKQKVPVGVNPIGTFLGKNPRLLRELFLVPQIPTDSTDSFFCILLPLLSSHTDLTILTDFLPFYPFTLLLFYLFTSLLSRLEIIGPEKARI